MPTSLASQLASQVSSNAQILLDRSRTRGKHASVDSFLFSGRDAAEHDLDSIFALGRSGFEALSILNPGLTTYEESLFSYGARTTDRTLLTPEAARELDAALEGFMREIGAYLLEGAAAKVLEWLVRRFRINEFNVRSVVELFLPYHETQHWGKMLTILRLNGDAMLKFLLPHQKQAQQPTSATSMILPRPALVQAMMHDADLARFVGGMLGTALKGYKGNTTGKLYQTLVAFWAAAMHDYVLAHGASSKGKNMAEGTTAFVFAAVLQPLMVIPKIKTKKGRKYDRLERDTIFTSYILLAALSSQAPNSLTPAALKAVVSAMVGAAATGNSVGARQLVNALVAVCEAQAELPESDSYEETLDKILRVPDCITEISVALVSWEGAEKVISPFLPTLVNRLSSSDSDKALQAYQALDTLSSAAPPSTLIRRLASLLLRSEMQSTSPVCVDHVRSLLSSIHQCYPLVLRDVREDVDGDEQTKDTLDQLLMSLSFHPSSTVASGSEKLRDAILASSNADAGVRSKGTKTLLALLAKEQPSDGEELDAIYDTLLARVMDTDIGVLESLYDDAKSFASIVLSTESRFTRYLTLLSGTLFPADDDTNNVKPPKRAVVKAHLKFVIRQLLHCSTSWSGSWRNDLFHRVVFPYLLFSKPRGKTAEAVWELISASGVGSTHEWLIGCTEVMGHVQPQDETEKAQRLNAVLCSRIAANITSPQDIQELINKLHDTNPHVRLLALLITREVLKVVDGSDAGVQFAHQVLDVVIRGKQAHGIQIQLNEEELEDVFSATSTKLSSIVVHKPSSRSTDALLTVALMIDIAALQPSGSKEKVNWVCVEDKTGPGSMTYASLLRQLYAFANTYIESAAARMQIVRALFSNLGNEAGIFLTGVWLRSDSSSATGLDVGLTTTALYHATAFLQAHQTPLPTGAVDFQTLLPALLIALSNPLQELRMAAVECLKVMKDLTVDENGKGKKFQSVYAFDRVYGCNKNQAELQYLSPDDFAHYVSALVNVGEHFQADGEYLGAWHAEQLSSTATNQEKESTKYRSHVLCYLVSHINALSVLPEAQIGLLQIVTPCFVKAQLFSGPAIKKSSSSRRKKTPETSAALLLLPFLQYIVDSGHSGNPTDPSNESAKLALKVVFGDPAIFDLEDVEYKGANPWSVFCGILEKVFGGDEVLASLRNTLLECTSKAWTTAILQKERRIKIVEFLIDTGVAADFKGYGGDETAHVKSLLAKLFGMHTDDRAQIIISLLVNYCQGLGEVVERDESTDRPPKKARVDPSQREPAPDASSEAQSGPYPRLALLAEVLASLSITQTSSDKSGQGLLPPSFDLIAHLLETLSQVMRFQASDASRDGAVSVDFVCQNLMASIDSVAAGVRDPPNLTPTPIRLDVLVELIRISPNPQTLHQALLLVAELARLAPESVLRNVMPIFTFMGVGAAAMAGSSGSKGGIEGNSSGASAMLSRDDGYGWRIVQKTVDSIVPVMVSSLKQTHPSGGLDLYIGARDFLRVFTDAANHIPRYRRTNFFSHLISVLGPKDFLAPICLLLIEKSANKIVRSQQQLLGAKSKDKSKDSGDAQGALALPTALVHHFEPWLQMWVLAEMLRESERLLQQVMSPEDANRTFLDDSSLEEHSLPPAAVFKRRCQAIIAFVGHAAKTFPTAPKVLAKDPEAMDVVPTEGSKLSDVVCLLIALSIKSKQGTSTEVKLEDIAKSARASMARVLGVMSAADFIDATLFMLPNEDHLIQEGALSLLSSRLPRISVSVRQASVPSIIKIVGFVHKILSQQPEQSLRVSAFNAVRVIGQSLCTGEESSITTLVPLLVGALSVRSSVEIVSAAVGALVALPAKLGPRLIPHFRDIVSQAVVVLRDGPEGLITDIVQLLRNLLVSIPSFWSKAELTQTIKLFLDLSSSTSSSRPPVEVTGLMKTIAKKAPAKVLLPTLCEMWRGLGIGSPNMGALIGYFDLLKRSLRNAARPAVQENLRAIFNVFLEAFGITKGMRAEVAAAQVQSISAFVELVVKLNEPTFRPLFRRLYDWAFAGESDVDTKIMFCRVYIRLLDYFKGLMNPYMSMLFTPLTSILKSYANAEVEDNDLLPPVFETLAKSLACDDGNYWRDEHIRQLSSVLIQQIPVCVKLNSNEARSLLQECLVASADVVSDDSVLKAMNLGVLMHARAEDSREKIFALMCAETVWRAHGSKLLGFVAETATFIAECCEDENDVVTRESFRLKDAVESVAGSISGL